MTCHILIIFNLVSLGFGSEEGEAVDEAAVEEEDISAADAEQLAEITMKALYGALGFIGLIIFCFVFHFVH